MADEGSGPEPGSGQVEWVDLGEVGQAEVVGSDGGRAGGERPGPERRFRHRVRPVHVVVAGGVAIAAVLAVVRASDGSSPPVTSPTATASPDASSSVWTPPAGAPTAAVALPPTPVIRQVGPGILGVRAGWELFGFGPSAVVRIELAAGRVTTTGLPQLASSGPVAFIVGADRAFVRPLDDVAAFVVPDGARAQQLTGVLARANVMLPGPNPRLIWRQLSSAGPSAMGLADLDGTVVGQRVTTPVIAQGTLAADGAGYLYFIGIGGAYDVRPSGTKRITTGSVLAVGPRRWVTVECDEAARCSTFVVDVATGVRRAVGAARSPNAPIGPVAPDGSAAVLYRLGEGGGVSLQVLDLANGHTTAVRTTVNQGFQDGSVVWAPDSSRFFVIDPRGGVQVVDPATGRAQPLGVALPPLSQLGIRPVP